MLSVALVSAACWKSTEKASEDPAQSSVEDILAGGAEGSVFKLLKTTLFPLMLLHQLFRAGSNICCWTPLH